MKLSMMTLSLVACVALLGCGSSTEAPSASTQEDHDGDHASGEEHGHAHGEEHGHPEEGPHHGSLVELGNEEYHAEVVHDDASGSLTIYLLDSAAKNAVPIYAPRILVNLSHDGKAEQFALAASPQPTDPQGKSSRFVSTDAELAEDLDREGAEAFVVLAIGDKLYRGEIHHDHDHEGHHDDEDKHGHEE